MCCVSSASKVCKDPNPLCYISVNCVCYETSTKLDIGFELHEDGIRNYCLT